jgi:hypothetical protein
MLYASAMWPSVGNLQTIKKFQFYATAWITKKHIKEFCMMEASIKEYSIKMEH